MRRPASGAFLAQVLLLGALVLAIGWLVSNTLGSLERQNVASGFGFLSERAGFGINQTLIAYSENDSYGRVLAVGLFNTLLVSVLGIFFASLLGFVIGIARLSHNWIVSSLAAVYIEIFRNIPLLLQIFFWYFGVLRNLPAPREAVAIGESAFLSNRGISIPALVFESGIGLYLAGFAALVGFWIWWARRAHRMQILTGARPRIFWPVAAFSVAGLVIALFVAGVPVSLDMPALKGFNFRGGITIIPEFVALLAALSLYTASFIAEIVRAGILSVDSGQSEAASALGLPRGRALQLIVVPQALRVIIPPLTSQYLNLTKNSSLAVAIAYPDIVSVFAGTTLTQTGQAVEIIFITMVIYLTLSLITSFAMNRYNQRIALTGEKHVRVVEAEPA